MKHVSILVQESSVIEAIADPRYMFNAVNQFLQSTGKPALFHVQLVGLKEEIKLDNSIFSVHTDALLEDIDKTDWLEFYIVLVRSSDKPKAAAIFLP